MALLICLSAMFFISVGYCFFMHGSEKLTDDAQAFFPKNRTEMVKGIAAIAIVIGHIATYSKNNIDSSLIRYYIKGLTTLGGTSVTLFFFISGFGCSQSMKQSHNKGLWLIRHIFSILIIYLLCYFSQTLFFSLQNVYRTDINKITGDLLQIKMPLTEGWYLRVQLLLYIFLFISMMAKQREIVTFLITILTLGSAFVFYKLGFVEHWWKSSFCFAIGSIAAEYRSEIKEYIKQKSTKGMILLLCVLIPFSYCLHIVTNGFVIKVLSNSLLCISIMVLIELIKPSKNMYTYLGKYSLQLFLVHTGFCSYFLKNQNPTNIKIIMVIVLSAIYAYLTKIISSKLLQALHIKK